MFCDSEGDKLLDSLGVLLLPWRRTRAAAWTVSLRLSPLQEMVMIAACKSMKPQPDNIPLYSSLANAAGSLLIIPLCKRKKSHKCVQMDQLSDLNAKRK